MRVPRKEYTRSRHQRLFEENVGKTGKDAIYELLSERFGSCIYAQGSKIGEVVAAQLAQASSARPGEPGCFLQKQQPSGGIFWRAQVGLDQGGPSNRPPQQGPNIFQRTTNLKETLTQFMQVTMSNHKSTESALKNLEIQLGQLAKQLAEKSSNNFGANTKKNPKEECNAVMTRNKKRLVVDDKDKVALEKQIVVKDDTEKNKEEVTDVTSQESEKPLMVKEKEINDQEKEIEMASRKRKSIGARPTAQYDTRRFHSLDAWNRYTDNVLGRSILPERKVEIYHTEFDDFKIELERRNLHKCLTNLADGTIDVALVKEFYANLYRSEDPSPKQARVRGHLVKIDAYSLNTFLETPVVLEEGETLPTYSRYCRLPSDHREIEAALCIPGMGFILNVEGHPRRILKKDLTTLAQVWSVLSYSNLTPTSHTSDLIVDRVRLGFPTLLTTLCRARGVVSNNLTFERLSPAINLAYIRKNCWNIDDLTVAFPGARRARVRPVDIPSTFATPSPTPTSTFAAPSVPAHVNT
ncbi:hypothetical protein HKD37_07G019529 [Glycine soja]